MEEDSTNIENMEADAESSCDDDSCETYSENTETDSENTIDSENSCDCENKKDDCYCFYEDQLLFPYKFFKNLILSNKFDIVFKAFEEGKYKFVKVQDIPNENLENILDKIIKICYEKPTDILDKIITICNGESEDYSDVFRKTLFKISTLIKKENYYFLTNKYENAFSSSDESDEPDDENDTMKKRWLYKWSEKTNFDPLVELFDSSEKTNNELTKELHLLKKDNRILENYTYPEICTYYSNGYTDSDSGPVSDIDIDLDIEESITNLFEQENDKNLEKKKCCDISNDSSNKEPKNNRKRHNSISDFSDENSECYKNPEKKKRYNADTTDAINSLVKECELITIDNDKILKNKKSSDEEYSDEEYSDEEYSDEEYSDEEYSDEEYD